MQNSYDVPGKTFWKKNDNVPGRPVSATLQNLHMTRESKSVSPKKGLSKSKHRKTSSSSSFQEFQDSTEDAWDIGDDDFCLTSGLSIHPRTDHSTAMKVLSNHSKLTFNNDFTNSNCYQPGNRSIPATHCVARKEKISSDATVAAPELKTAPTKKELPPTHPNVPSRRLPGPGIGVRLVESKSRMLLGSRNPALYSGTSERESARLEQFQRLINSQNTDLKELMELSWSGVPYKVRPVTWKLLSGYLPTCSERREGFLQRRKEEYVTFIRRYYDSRNEELHHETYRQIHIDVPRMSPLVPLFQQDLVQGAFERILYILALRHPASGYVQGMNDLVTPFFVVFLQDIVPLGTDVESYDVSQLCPENVRQVEADSYWCMAKLLDGIQDNYTFAQPGIQQKVHTLKELIQRIDAPLHTHLTHHSIEYLQFSFRWMNNLLMRELPLGCTIRLWDTYLSEPNGFSRFHLYVCAAFLKHWSKQLLQEKDFQGLMLMLQNLPTMHWGDNEISLLVAEAYRLKFTFDDAPNHLQPKEK